MMPLSKQRGQGGSNGHRRITFRFWPLGAPEAYTPEQNGIVERFFRSLKGESSGNTISTASLKRGVCVTLWHRTQPLGGVAVIVLKTLL